MISLFFDKNLSITHSFNERKSMQQSKEMSLEELQDTRKDLYEIIKIRYFEPFINNLVASDLSWPDQIKIIREAFRYLQVKSSPSMSSSLKFLYDFNNASMNDVFKKTLLNRPNLKQDFVNLGFIYLERNKQKRNTSKFLWF